MSVQSYRADAGMATLVLREGGEVTFPASIVARVEPDEIPFESPAAREDARRRLAQGEPREAPAVPVVDASALVPEAVLASRPFAALISTVAATHDVDVRLVHAVIEQESNYQARARSKKGARGLMQLMPATARGLGVDDPFDPAQNLDGGARFIRDMLRRYGGDAERALAAYNAGPGAVDRYGGIPPFAETQAYVPKVLTRYRQLGAAAPVARP